MASASPQPLPKTHWEDLANGYDGVMSRDPAMHQLYKVIVSQLPSAPDAILDLGTGTGALLQLARARFPFAELVGLDPAPTMLEQARTKTAADPRTSFLLGSAHEIDVPGNSFDAVISNFALHHLSHEEKRQCAHEIFRVLKPGGRLVYGDQHCRRMGDPHDPAWVEDMFDLFSTKARHYLRTAGIDRMILQIKLIPAFLLAEGEIPATVEYWLECLTDAGFASLEVIATEPEYLYNRVIVAVKPGGDYGTAIV
jgi:ubiquinone/menaquinone biosynthesis C-methylase UbiE